MPSDVPLNVKNEAAYNFWKHIFKILTQGEVVVGMAVAIPTIILWSSELQNRKLDRRVSNFEYSFKIKKELREAHDRCKKLVRVNQCVSKADKIKQLILDVSAYIDLLEQIQQYKDGELIITTISNVDIYKSLVELQRFNQTNENLVEKIGKLLTRLLIYEKDDIKLKEKGPIEGIYFLFDHSEFICIDFMKLFKNEKKALLGRDEEDPMFLFKNNSKFRKCKIDIETFVKFARRDEEVESGVPVFEFCEYYIGNKLINNLDKDFSQDRYLKQLDDAYSAAILKDLEGRK
ncbi:TPA: hypothetical protein U1369_001568 [Streptococcus suis]|nr:hypothetical protein [Streptococcus suis]HEM5308930.1 hypothetical protein [Streptococcus suis]